MPNHEGSAALNALSLCLDQTGYQDTLHELYGANPGALEPVLVARYPELRGCLDDPATGRTLEAEWALLKSWNLSATPTFYKP